MRNIDRKTKKIFLIMSTVLFFVMFFTVHSKTSLASDCSDLEGDEKKACEENEDKIDDKESEIEKLEKKAETYEKIIKLKQKQQGELSKKINSLDNEIKETKQNIEKNITTISNLNNDIDSLEDDITKNEELIKAQKELLSKILRSYYESDGGIYTKILLGIRTFSKITLNRDYLSQASDKITEITSNLKALEIDLQEKKEKLVNDKEELIEKRSDLEDEKMRLSTRKIEKNTVLIQTQGDEVKYKKKLAKIEEQKKNILGDINNLYNANFAEISAFATGLPKPISGLASTSWYYSQRDSRWGKECLVGGNKCGSDEKFEDIGCAVTAVAMTFTYHKEIINPLELSTRDVFQGLLIAWPTSWGRVNRYGTTRHYGVNWNTVDNELAKNNPVIVFINARGGAGHYVVIHGKDKKGKYVVHDPYWGPNIYLDSTVELLSKLYKVSIPTTSIDQMILYK